MANGLKNKGVEKIETPLSVSEQLLSVKRSVENTIEIKNN